MNIELPYPPSGNHMWKHTKTGGHYLTEKARAYYLLVNFEIIKQGAQLGIDQPMSVTCTLHPPDNRRRDMDNAWKVISDSLTRADLWEDDHLVRKLTLEWAKPIKGGKVLVSLARHVENPLTS